METKKCKHCNCILPISEFAEDRRSKDGYRKICKACAGVHEKRGISGVATIVRRSIEGGIAALKGITPQELIAELRYRGYHGKLTYTKEVVV